MPFGIARRNFTPTMAAVGGENVRTTLWVAAVVSAGGSVSAGRRTLINNLLNSLDTNGVTSLLNRLWLHAGENTQSATIDLINRSTLTLVNTPTFTTDRGYAGNGSSSYLNLGSATIGTQNSSSFGFYCRTNQAALDVNCTGSLSSASTISGCSINWSDGKIYYSMHDNDGDTGRTTPSSRIGLYVCTRTASTTHICYKDGTSLGNTGITSSGITTQNFYIGANNNIGTADKFTANQFAMSFLGAAGMNATQAGNFTTTIQTYLTAVGA